MSAPVTFHGGWVALHHGDSREVLKTLADSSIDSVVCDPPYALVSIGKRFGADGAVPAQFGRDGAYQRASAGFMGKKWDTGETAFAVEFWAEVLRVLKPGGHVVAFGGTRTYHRLACAIEDAGFEIRDQLVWCYGSGFPKSHDVSKGIDKAAGAAREVVGRYQPPNGKVWNLENDKARSDVGAVGHSNRAKSLDVTAPATPEAKQWAGWGTALKPAVEPIVMARKPLQGTVAANVLAHGTGAINVEACRVTTPVLDSERRSSARGPSKFFALGDKQEGERHNAAGRWPPNLLHDGSDEVVDCFPNSTSGAMKAGTRRAAQDAPGSVCYGTFGGNATSSGIEASTGSAARFFPAFPLTEADRIFYSAKADSDDRLNSKHPTVKPLDLMRWLVRLVTPKGGTVLDPFAGTGPTGHAALIEGMRAILCEREDEYVEDITRRMGLVYSGSDERARKLAKLETVDGLPLFGGSS